MTDDPVSRSLVPLDLHNLDDFLPEVQRLDVEISVHSFKKPLDSSNMGPEHWLHLTKLVEQHYSTQDGFVVLHGTDTMAFTASALSFLMPNLGKPVIITGSQLPLGKLRTDGVENLVTAIEIAADTINGRPAIQEVAIYFGASLFRGNRTHKSNTENFNAIESANFPALVDAGIHLRYNERVLRRPQDKFTAGKSLSDRVGLVKFFPGIRPGFVRQSLLGDDIKVAVLETYGSGNLPTHPEILEILEEAAKAGIWMINVTQCSKGFVEQGLYKTSTALRSLGLISAGDMTTEAALTKAMVLLDRCETKDDFEREFIRSMCGEVTNFSVLRS